MPDIQRLTPATRLVQKPDFDMRFPPLSKTVAEVSSLIATAGDVPDTPALTQVVNADPVVAASVLRRINSAYYSVRRRVGDLPKAIQLLGFEEVADIVLTAGLMNLRDILCSEEQEHIFDVLMRMSIGTAAYCKRLAQHLNLRHSSMAFTAGLLHTTGRLVLLHNRPDDYEALWCTNEYGLAPTVTSEQLIFGTDHAALGGLAAERWHLPPEIAQIVRNHLTPGHLKSPELREIALTVSVAVNATERLCLGPEPKEPRKLEPTAAVHALARLTESKAANLTAMLAEQQQEVRAYIGSMMTS